LANGALNAYRHCRWNLTAFQRDLHVTRSTARRYLRRTPNSRLWTIHLLGGFALLPAPNGGVAHYRPAAVTTLFDHGAGVCARTPANPRSDQAMVRPAISGWWSTKDPPRWAPWSCSRRTSGMTYAGRFRH